MEYVEGRTLRDILRDGRKILPERALEITAAVLNALDYSHRAGIIHRDIKPANVMLNAAGDVKVMDFGIARAISDSSATMTQTAAVIGTAQYLSPEQARGEQVDARSDLYSTGCLLFELLTGRPPFVGDSPLSVAYQHVREEAPIPSAVEPAIPPEIDAVTMKSLAKPVEERYQSAAEMRADIERALDGQPVLAPAVVSNAALETEPFLAADTAPVPGATAVHRYDDSAPERKRTALWVLLGLLLAAVAVGGYFVATRDTAEDPVAQASVPDLRNMTVAQAQRELAQVGLAMGQRVPKNSPTVDKGLILSQSVPPDDRVDEGSRIDVTVSAGTQQVRVPDVSNSNLAAATATLEGLGFKVDPQPDEQSPERRNEVTGTDPLPDTLLPVGSTVTVSYSTGFVVVDSVVGMTQEEATELLDDKGFQVVPSFVESDAEEGRVTRQQPRGNSQRPYGSVVVISVSLGPAEVTTAPPPTTSLPPTTSAPPTTSDPPTTSEAPTSSTPEPSATTPTRTTLPTSSSATL
jgi:serine/threonine-protein kinase